MKIVNKLRKKIIIITLASLSTILVLMLIIINSYNFAGVSSGADNVLEAIQRAGGAFKEHGGREQNDETSAKGKPSDEERYSTRYFTYAFNDDGSLEKIAFNISSFSENDAEEIAKTYKNETNNGWYKFFYRYKNYTYGDKQYFTLIDQSRELEPSFRVLWTSAITGFAGILITFIVLIPLSKMIVKPIEESLRKQKRFISDASHELKTPLAIISLNNELEETEKGESENTQNIAKQTNLLSKMIKNLNDLAKMDEIEDVPSSSMDITKMVNETCSSFSGIAQQYKKKMIINVEKDLTYFGNQEKIARLFSILLDNAIKYSLTYIEISVQSSVSPNKGMTIVVRNDAEKIPEGNLDVVFDRFYRLQEARASSIAGTGIGLSMAKEIVDMHHGKISATGKEGVFEIKAVL